MKASPRTRMFENLSGEHIQLETIDVTESTSAINLRFRDTSHYHPTDPSFINDTD